MTTTVSKPDTQLQQQSTLFKCSSIQTNNNNFNNTRLDSSPIQIDSLNNNNNYNNNMNNAIYNNDTHTLTIDIVETADTVLISKTAPPRVHLGDVEEGLSSSPSVPPPPHDLHPSQHQAQAPGNKKAMKRNTSLINFKSLDFHLRSIYSGLRSKHNSDSHPSSSSSTGGSGASGIRKAPYLKIETCDKDESETLLLTYPQSPYQTRRSSYDNRSSSQLLNITQYERSRSQASSPYFLSPSPLPGYIRRSSTSDIMCKKSASSANNSRRPSASDLLRKARERKGSESGRLGRSVSHGGLPRGGQRGGRRTSMAF